MRVALETEDGVPIQMTFNAPRPTRQARALPAPSSAADTNSIANQSR